MDAFAQASVVTNRRLRRQPTLLAGGRRLPVQSTHSSAFGNRWRQETTDEDEA